MTTDVTVVERRVHAVFITFFFDHHKINYHRNAVIRKTWSRALISNIVTAQYSLNGLVTALCESMQLDDEIMSAQSYESGSGASSAFIQKYARNSRSV